MRKVTTLKKKLKIMPTVMWEKGLENTGTY